MVDMESWFMKKVFASGPPQGPCGSWGGHVGVEGVWRELTCIIKCNN